MAKFIIEPCKRFNDIQSKIFCKTNRCDALPPLFFFMAAELLPCQNQAEDKKKIIFCFIFQVLKLIINV